MKILLTILALMLATPIAYAQPASRPASLKRAQIKEAEQRLSELGYWTGNIDGVFDQASQSALIAFQKYEGRTVTGRMTIEEFETIRDGALPKARETGYAHVEVDLDRQVMMIVSDDDRVRILPVSTGNDQPFVAEGQTSIAYTPRGRFLVYEKEAGWGTGPLGAMFYSNYISGGVAIHGSRSIPNQPASHGCIRVPMFAAREVSRRMPVGTIVLVYDKLSFVSAKDWVTDPQRKQAALAATTANAFDYVYESNAAPTRPRTGIKKTRSRINRA